MTSVTPQIFGYTEEKIMNLLNILRNFLYDESEILKICIKFPSIFSFGEDNICSKIAFLKDIGLEKIIIQNPMILIQNLELAIKRYNYLTKNNVIISDYNYKDLYLTDKRFISKHGISNQELFENYKNENKIIEEDLNKLYNVIDNVLSYTKNINIYIIEGAGHRMKGEGELEKVIENSKKIILNI